MTKFKRIMLALSVLLIGKGVMAMPHDQPVLHFYSNDKVSVGLVYSSGTNYSPNPAYHRVLEQVYVCSNGNQIESFSKFKTVVDSSGVMIVAKAVSGARLVLDFDSKTLTVLSSSLPDFKVDPAGIISIDLKASGISGFELDWSNPCAPKETN